MIFVEKQRHEGGKMKQKKKITDLLIQGISDIIMPVIHLLTAAGIMKGILIILSSMGILSESSDTYLVFNAIADSAFYFLPVLLAITAAKKFHASPFTAVAVAGVLLYPSLTTAMDAAESLRFLGIPMKSVIYHSSVIPILLTVALLHYIEKFFDSHLPELLRSSLTPLFSVVLASLAALLVFGPVGGIIGDGLASVYSVVYAFSPVIAGVILGAAVQPMVIFGFHWSLILIGINNLAVNGYDTVLPLMGTGVFAQVGAAMAVFVKTKRKDVRSNCVSASLSALFGVTEPAMFGINLPLKKPMIAVLIAGAAGGALVGMSGAHAMAFGLPSLVTLPIFFGEGFAMLVAGCVLSMILAFVLTLFMKFDADALKTNP